jgi:hypothetical protein
VLGDGGIDPTPPVVVDRNLSNRLPFGYAAHPVPGWLASVDRGVGPGGLGIFNFLIGALVALKWSANRVNTSRFFGSVAKSRIISHFAVEASLDAPGVLHRRSTSCKPGAKRESFNGRLWSLAALPPGMQDGSNPSGRALLKKRVSAG